MANISVVGLGKVGVTLASCLAVNGHRVVGVDLSQQTVGALNDRTFRTTEPGVLDRLLSVGADRFTATTDSVEGIAQSDITFIIVPTPSNVLGGFSLQYVRHACDEVGAGIRAKQGPHTVALVSTVLPGSSDRIIIPHLERASGLKIGQGLGYVYNPAFIALGDVVKGFEQPDYVLLGEADAAAGGAVLAVHQSMTRSSTPIARMSPIEAEITKIASNTHETMRVSFANMLLSVCAEVPGADVDRITDALAHRMGKRFFRGAVPYGGPCWPRDNRALAAFMDAIGVPSRMPRTVDLFNDEHGRYVLRKILELVPAGRRVAIVGLAYKPGTPVIEQSFPLQLAAWLVREGRPVTGWDPLAMDEARRALSGCVQFAETAEECIAAADAVIVGNPLPELRAVDWSKAVHAVVIDCWRCLPPEVAGMVQRYVALGRGPGASVTEWMDDSNLGPRLELLVN